MWVPFVSRVKSGVLPSSMNDVGFLECWIFIGADYRAGFDVGLPPLPLCGLHRTEAANHAHSYTLQFTPPTEK